MKKFLSYILICLVVFSANMCFATEEISAMDISTIGEVETIGETNVNSAEISEVPEIHGEGADAHYHDESGEVVYLENYEQYEDLINSMDEQVEYKKMYNDMVKDMVEYYKTAERSPIYRAKVIEASEPEVYYGYYQYMYKSTYQILKIEILDGEYKGKVIDEFNYVLTVDSYENMKLPEVKEGTIINVAVEADETGNLTAYSASIDSTIERWGWIALLIVIAIIFVLIYAGKNGFKSLIPIVLILDLLILVFVPMALDGINIMLLLSVITILSMITIAALKLGLNSKFFTAVLSTIVIIIAMVLGIYAFDSIATLSGITFEASSFSEAILPEVIEIANSEEIEIRTKLDFHQLNIALVSIMILFACAPIICKTIEVYDENKNEKDSYKLVMEKMKEYVSDKILAIVPILIAIIIPKYMMFYVNKCTFIEFANSEVLINDVTRILYIVIAMAISMPITVILGKALIDDKASESVEEAQEKVEDNNKEEAKVEEKKIDEKTKDEELDSENPEDKEKEKSAENTEEKTDDK